jgi:hypothetical protein
MLREAVLEALKELDDADLLSVIQEVIEERAAEVDYVDIGGNPLALSDEAKILFVNRVLTY